jgi:protein-tyrosine-phosphatase
MEKGVLFVCIGNACRSIMAEALARHRYGDSLRVASAGIAPLGHVPQITCDVLIEAGISCDGLYSKSIDDIDPGSFDLIVNLTDHIMEQFVPESFEGKIVNLYVPDPYGRRLYFYRAAREQIEWLVSERLPEWLGGQ